MNADIVTPEQEQIALSIAVRGHCMEYFPHLPAEFAHRSTSGLNLRQIMEGLGIKSQLIMGVVVNGKPRPKDYQPVDGDRIILISPPTGG